MPDLKTESVIIEMDLQGMCLTDSLLLELFGRIVSTPNKGQVDIVLRNVNRHPMPLLYADYGDVARRTAREILAAFVGLLQKESAGK